MNKIKGKGKGVEAEELNKFMATIRHKMNKVQHHFVDEDKYFTAHDIKDKYLGKQIQPKMLVTAFFEHNEQMKKLVGIEFAIATWKRYYTTLNHIKEFLNNQYQKTNIPI